LTAHQVWKERDWKELCSYCAKPLDQKAWKSDFQVSKHYKTNVCSCGKTTKIQVRFEGSGHDTWHKPKPNLANKAPLDVQVQAMRL
jgi:hypothetical protein